ncbi:MAG: hypothetical protein EXR55_04095 [Dehalococcoidia bacterium]|nr:hypothetical protein [Dehalococcoidia bacterium]
MPRPVPAPDPLSKPFWDACAQGKLMVQKCTMCDRKQFPPEATCRNCGWAFNLTWIPTSGRGTIVGYSVTYDTRINAWVPDQPFNNAVIALEEDPAIKFHSNLPGVKVNEVPVGAKVEVYFLDLEDGIKLPEWKLVHH